MPTSSRLSKLSSPLRGCKRAPAPRALARQRGFSIIEVVITAAIIGIITAIVTLKYNSFNNLILLKNQAFQIALDLREAQSRSLSAVGRDSGFRSTYGVYFNTAQRDRYTIFVDANQNGLYSSGEEIEVRLIDSRFRLQSLCSGSTLSVVFRRPNFDAVINNGALSQCAITIETMNDGTTRSISLNAVGQIAVD